MKSNWGESRFVRNAFEFVVLYLVLSVVAMLGMLISSFPNYPKTVNEWLRMLFLVLPVTFIFELIGMVVWSNRLAQSIEEKSAKRAFSWLRIGYGFVAMLLIFGVAWWMGTFLSVKGT